MKNMGSHQTSSKPLVSVIIASYNYGRFVSRAIESVQAQTYANWECLVVDDGSTDDTRAVIERYVQDDERIQYHYQTNRGPSAARNAGMERCAGKYIQFIDADDLIIPTKLELQVDYLEQQPEVDIVYGDMEYFTTDEAGEIVVLDARIHNLWLPRVSPSGAGPEVLKHLVAMNIMGIHTSLVRRPASEVAVLFDGDLRGPEDWYYWISCAAAGKRFRHVPGTVALVRTQPTSLSSSVRRMLPYFLMVRHKVRSLVADVELLRINDKLAEEESYWLLNEIQHGSLYTGFRDLMKLAFRTGEMKWLRYALALSFRINWQRLGAAVRGARARALRIK